MECFVQNLTKKGIYSILNEVVNSSDALELVESEFSCNVSNHVFLPRVTLTASFDSTGPACARLAIRKALML